MDKAAFRCPLFLPKSEILKTSCNMSRIAMLNVPPLVKELQNLQSQLQKIAE